MSYQHLSYLQRCRIEAYYRAGYFQKDIAKEVGVHPSTVSREIRRNLRWNGVYSAGQGDFCYHDRRKKSRRPKIFTAHVEAFVKEKLLLEWSPEQISGYAKRHMLFTVSHERIYQYVLLDKKKGGDLYKHLRHGKKRYKKRYGSPKRQGPIKNKVMIDERPKIVEEKTRLGDWEIDTIIGKQQQKAILTLVERVSKFTLIGEVGTKSPSKISNQMIQLLTPIKEKVFTLTADNGIEFAHHENTAKALQANVYFAHPYHSWERGLNENTNGLIRQYIPKGSDFNEVSYTKIQTIMERLNNRPRKSLGYATPKEIFEQDFLAIA